MALSIVYQDQHQHFNRVYHISDVPNDAKMVWYDFNQPTSEEKDILKSKFNLADHRIEESIYTVSRPKVAINHTNMQKYLVLHSINSEDFSAEPMSITVQEHQLITIHQNDIQALNDITAETLKTTNVDSIDYIAIRIIDKVTANYFKYIDDVEDTVFSFENKNVDSTNNRSLMKDVFTIRSSIIKLKRVLFPMEELLDDFIEEGVYNNEVQDNQLMKHIHSRLQRQCDTLDACEHMTDDIRDNNESYRSSRINKVMNVLTILSSIFFPLSLLTGWYGMNFSYMPELQWHYSYFVFTAFSLVIAVVLIIIFKRKQWF
ncbi:CorA metal ion transporter family protein [Staphylococcus simiae]|uniref:CorA-like Mg2+ transporter protein n=1 Tax=Staphylococcus simiae CCM 7213 = CCUG 51256 TaxID=911238 RepID=G5JFT9_9STAP|nr:CorA metal ion transporter family protein [Staphylococcus simiae]EHJ08957.1 hypothetical protein SS7213T_01516 [Staphylococcus simiae CCM 7213 = CCUG 51256]PNZ12857.1 magnesium transporter CorA [Staphylococcus simiae]SNV82464.1 CorA-like Mg2+ transporter protein [Staphylococcus simiae]